MLVNCAFVDNLGVSGLASVQSVYLSIRVVWFDAFQFAKFGTPKRARFGNPRGQSLLLINIWIFLIRFRL